MKAKEHLSYFRKWSDIAKKKKKKKSEICTHIALTKLYTTCFMYILLSETVKSICILFKFETANDNAISPLFTQ